MALVMLPCELPWWISVQNILTKLLTTKNTLELVEGMQRIHDICNVSLDPDEDEPDPEQFIGLLNFLDNELTSEERSNFLNKTLPNIIGRALNLKQWKPKDGLHFSLQQQPDCTELQYSFVSSLLANAFFSTFPKRTEKSHPTLQNFNFCNFFKHLSMNSQKAKLRSLLHYFDLIDETNSSGSLKILRQVMSSKEWLTIEDWLECSLPLCPLQIRHEGRIERADAESLQLCFSCSKIGGKVLGSGNSQECITLSTFPEVLCVLLNVEALEDNEVLTIEGARHISRITDAKNRACLEKLGSPCERTICCVDAEDYTRLPVGQYEEDNVLRELNKCLLALQQKQTKRTDDAVSNSAQNYRHRRLSPIGESLSSTHSETANARSESPKNDNNNVPNAHKVQIDSGRVPPHKGNPQKEGILNNRRGKFIVLGSSGECLPIKRKQEPLTSLYSSVESSEDEFHSAKTSLDDGSEDEEFNKRYSIDLDTQEKRNTFAQRLRDALRRETSSISPSSTDSSTSYAVGITVGGSGLGDQDIKIRRGGSQGFMLQEDSLDEDFLQDALQQEREWIDKFKSKQSNLSKKESNKSSDYSFSTDSELEEVYEQFSKWLEDPVIETDKGTNRILDGRDLAVVQFAGSLLKRTLSESFAGVPLSEGCETALGGVTNDCSTNRKNKLVLNAKSLSLELARQKHRLAAQLSKKAENVLQEKFPIPVDKVEVTNGDELTNQSSVCKKRKNLVLSYASVIVQTLEDICVNIAISQDVSNNDKISQIAQKPKEGGIRAVSTGNWGCGSSRKGEIQLKAMIQWLAASVAGVPALIYYTAGHQELASLDTVYRLLRDRKWNVKNLTQATLRYSSHALHGRNDSATLFEDLIGVERHA